MNSNLEQRIVAALEERIARSEAPVLQAVEAASRCSASEHKTACDELASDIKVLKETMGKSASEANEKLAADVDAVKKAVNKGASEQAKVNDKLAADVGEVKRVAEHIAADFTAALSQTAAIGARQVDLKNMLETHAAEMTSWRDDFTPKIDNIDARCYDLEGNLCTIASTFRASPHISITRIALPSHASQ